MDQDEYIKLRKDIREILREERQEYIVFQIEQSKKREKDNLRKLKFWLIFLGIPIGVAYIFAMLKIFMYIK